MKQCYLIQSELKKSVAGDVQGPLRKQVGKVLRRLWERAESEEAAVAMAEDQRMGSGQGASDDEDDDDESVGYEVVTDTMTLGWDGLDREAPQPLMMLTHGRMAMVRHSVVDVQGPEERRWKRQEAQARCLDQGRGRRGLG